MPGQDIGNNDKREGDDGGGDEGRRRGGICVNTEGLFMVLGGTRDMEGSVKVLELDDDAARRQRRRAYVLVLLIVVVVTTVVVVGVVGGLSGVVGRNHKEGER